MMIILLTFASSVLGAASKSPWDSYALDAYALDRACSSVVG